MRRGPPFPVVSKIVPGEEFSAGEKKLVYYVKPRYSRGSAALVLVAGDGRAAGVFTGDHHETESFFASIFGIFFSAGPGGRYERLRHRAARQRHGRYPFHHHGGQPPHQPDRKSVV